MTDHRPFDLELRAQQEAAEAKTLLGRILDRIGQGLFVIDPDGAVRPEYSTELENLCGRRSLGGRPFQEVLLARSELGPDAQATAEAVVMTAMGQPGFLFDANRHALPTMLAFHHPTSGRRTYELGWSSLVDDQEEVVGVLVSVRDVTELRALRERANRQDRRQLVVDEILDLGSAQLTTVLDEVRERLEQASEAPLAVHQLHTVKGVARNHGLSTLAEAAHRAESQLAAGEPVCTAVGAVLDVVRLYLDVDRALSRRREVVVEVDTIEAALDEVRRGCERAAADRGKRAPEVRVEGDLRQRLGQSRRAAVEALTHVFTNAVAHGLELPEDRIAAGKPPEGRIAVRLRSDGTQLLIEVRDDGAGLDLSALRAALRARRATPPTDDDDLVQHLFDVGVSTAAVVDGVAGRGVGLGAAREALRKLGGDLWIELEGRVDARGRSPLVSCLLIPI